MSSVRTLRLGLSLVLVALAAAAATARDDASDAQDPLRRMQGEWSFTAANGTSDIAFGPNGRIYISFTDYTATTSYPWYDAYKGWVWFDNYWEALSSAGFCPARSWAMVHTIQSGCGGHPGTLMVDTPVAAARLLICVGLGAAAAVADRWLASLAPLAPVLVRKPRSG